MTTGGDTVIGRTVLASLFIAKKKPIAELVIKCLVVLFLASSNMIEQTSNGLSIRATGLSPNIT
jgi:hypothetical protein